MERYYKLILGNYSIIGYNILYTNKTNRRIITMNSLPKREEIDQKYKWNLEDIYESVNKWEEDFKNISKNIESIIKYKGTLKESADNLLECLKSRDELMSLCEKLFVYARMKKDENKRSLLISRTD